MASYTWLSTHMSVVFLRKALCWQLDFRTVSLLGSAASREGAHHIAGGTQNPRFRQMSKNHGRFKWAGSWEGPWSTSQLSPRVADEETVVQKGDGPYVGHTAHD